jgi:hypothetical protein
MKTRRDFVTNSSSSSFIISRDDITHGRLLDILLEMANAEAETYGDDDDSYTYDWSDVTSEGVGHFRIREFVDEPYRVYGCDDDHDYGYHNVFVVDNEDCIRYNWNVVRKVLDKYGIKWERGYCD